MQESSAADATVVITGATSGFGTVAATLLARDPSRTLVVAARDPERGARAARAIGPGTVVLPLDLGQLESVRAFPLHLADAGLPPLGSLVANAGVQHTDRRQVTADGLEATFATNHLGHFLLIRLLLEQLAPDGRIVLTASGTHKRQRVRNLGFPPPQWADAQTLATPGEGSGQVAYATSKLANAMTTVELARRIDALRPGAGIAVHGFDPGLVPATGLVRHYPAPLRALYGRAAPLLSALLPSVSTPAAAGAALARLVADPAFAAPPNGRYVEGAREAAFSALARDPAAGARLWEESERLVGLATASGSRCSACR